jgi:pimeloyl-ACP methyl ester carboxylesterase
MGGTVDCAIMPRARANGIELEWDEFGSRNDPPLLLIMGLGAQMIAWDEEFCARLAGSGLRVIRFDNRDVGLSTKIEDGPPPNLLAAFMGDTSSAAYTLRDMADDAVGLLDALGLTAAHIVGASMGGMIAQTMAIRHPARVITLTSIMSTTGDVHVGQPSSDALPLLMTPAPPERDAFIEHGLGVARVLAAPGTVIDEHRTRERAARSFDRGFYPMGVGRQLVAILASGDRTPALRSLDLPTLVIHGEGDPLIDPSGGRATAAAIPGARLLSLPGMGHDLPKELWDTIVDAIVDLVETAQQRV